jgi:type I restriction enzyme S subunit
MSKQWPRLKLGDVLIPAAREETVDASKQYRLLGIRLDGQGPFLRETLMGTQTSAAKLFRVAKGDFIYSRLFACRGAFGVISKELDGCFVSSEFPTFVPVPEKVDVEFLKYWFRLPSVIARVDEDCTGSTPLTRNRFKENFFLALEISLPPLAEQRRMLAQIEELAAQINEARTLRRQAAEEVEALLRSILTHDEHAKPTPMRELVKLRPPDVTVRADETYQFAGVYCFGRGVFKGSRKSGMDFAYSRLTRLRAGEFVYPKLMAWEGALGIVPPECDGCVVSTEFPVFEVNEDRVLHEILDTHFRTPSVWPEISGSSTGTNVRRRRLNPQDFLDYKMPLPSRETQFLLRKVRTEADALKRFQAATAAELDALLPAVLDKAFKGEL